MFTGIVQGMGTVASIKPSPGGMRLAVTLPPHLSTGLVIGASVAIDGVCLTVVEIQGSVISFDVIEETLTCTTLGSLQLGASVNLERAAKMGDEIGGHLLSGHIIGTASVTKAENSPGNLSMEFQGDPAWTKYLFPKGYIAIDGISLTLVTVTQPHFFSVQLIPETRRSTTIAQKQIGDNVNIEVDVHTQAIVDTVEKMLKKKS